mgnify:CR=1 FL=1
MILNSIINFLRKNSIINLHLNNVCIWINLKFNLFLLCECQLIYGFLKCHSSFGYSNLFIDKIKRIELSCPKPKSHHFCKKNLKDTICFFAFVTMVKTSSMNAVGRFYLFLQISPMTHAMLKLKPVLLLTPISNNKFSHFK